MAALLGFVCAAALSCGSDSETSRNATASAEGRAPASAQELADSLGEQLARGDDADFLNETSPGFSDIAESMIASLDPNADVSVGACDSGSCLATVGGVAWEWKIESRDGRPVVVAVQFLGGGL